MSTKVKSLIALIIIIVLGAIFQKDYINEFPSYTHAWAQSDRYAIAKGFVNNDLNFFKPETFVLNHQFPTNGKPSQESITSVDFPIHEYLVAVFMKIFGTSSPCIFRIYTLLYSFLGLFFLFKLGQKITDSIYKAILIVIVAATSPVYVYYQSGFLPTIPSLSNAIIGLFFYFKFCSTRVGKDFNYSILFLTIAALNRTTFAIPLVAVLAIEFLYVLQKKSQVKSKIIAVTISIGSIIGYYFYNAYLRVQHGSMFLNQVMPATTSDEVFEILNIVCKKWRYAYFSMSHYVLFIVVSILAAVTAFRRKFKFDQLTSHLLFVSLTVFLGSLIFAALMLRQYPDHDYYFLDTFFLPLILLFIFGCALIPNINVFWLHAVKIIILGLLSTFLLMAANKSQTDRRVTGSWDRTSTTIKNFTEADKFLDSLNIPGKARILVIDSYAPNIPFLLMDRKGDVVISTRRDSMIKALAWEHDYIIVQNDFFTSDILSVFPEFLNKVTKVADNGKIIICSQNEVDQPQTLGEFLGFDTKIPSFERKMNFDSIIGNEWQNTTSTSKRHFSGTHAGMLKKEMNFGLTFKSKELQVLQESNTVLIVNAQIYRDSTMQLPLDVELVVSINENDKNTYYKSFSLKQLLNSNNEWEQINALFQLPKVTTDNHEFAIYLLNMGKNELLVDDFEFTIY